MKTEKLKNVQKDDPNYEWREKQIFRALIGL
jgi:hypothetical protein